MNLDALADDISELNYVLMRNWGKLPPDGDMDFFVTPEDRAALEAACAKHLDDKRWYDIRTIGDGYYPLKLEALLLAEDGVNWHINDAEGGLWKIPSPEAHFLTLYYHGLVHKGDDRYAEELKKVFWQWIRPIKPQDPGVGFHDINSN